MNRAHLARILLVTLSVLIAAKIVLMGIYSQTMQWVMDEFGQLQSARRLIDAGLYREIDPVKTVLPFAAYDCALRFGRSAVEVLRLARTETFLVAIITVGATGLAAFRLYQNVTLSLLSVLTLLSYSNFLERAFRVRNDTFATCFATVATVVLFGRRNRLRSYLVGILSMAAFLCTQKAIYAVVPVAIANLMLARAAGRTLNSAAQYAVGMASTLLLYCWVLGGWQASVVLKSVLFSPFSMADNLFHADYWPELRSFVAQTLQRNTIPYLLCGTGIAAIFVTANRKRAPYLAAGTIALLTTILVFNHPQPWPYVFVTCMPFLALTAPASIQVLPAHWHQGAVATICVLLSFSFLRNVSTLAQRNDDQLALAAKVESMLGLDERYFDGIGMVPTRKVSGSQHWWWWDLPTINALRTQLRKGDSSSLESIKAQQPKLWVTNYRTLNFREVTDSVFRDSTVRIDEHIFASGRKIEPGESARFLNLWSGSYVLRNGTGKVVEEAIEVDGVQCNPPCAIGVGVHDLRSRSTATTFLLPMDVFPDRPLPVPAEARDLFHGVYTF